MSGGRNGLQVAAIVLAAGRSTRMAPDNKLLAEFDGVPMVRRVATTAVASGARPVIVVTGFEAGRVVEALGGLDIAIVHNPAYGDGLSASLRTGLRALPPDCDGALICLGDMPAIESDDLRALMAAFAVREGRAICVPVRHGRRGNPVLWSAAFFGEIMAITGDTGAKGLIGRHEDCVTEVAMTSDGIFEDVDAPSDLARLKPKQGST